MSTHDVSDREREFEGERPLTREEAAEDEAAQAAEAFDNADDFARYLDEHGLGTQPVSNAQKRREEYLRRGSR